MCQKHSIDPTLYAIDAIPQVGYCQGMAFSAGVLLMYVPQEAAFLLLCQLMHPRGANMRQLFLPGFAELKRALARIDLLLARYDPRVPRHLGERR